MIYESILNKFKKQKLLAVLIDPENYSDSELSLRIEIADQHNVDLILIGGSLVSSNLHGPIETIKSLSNIPVVLFPGSLLQISGNADAILLISLISGRNPESLIGNHVAAAPTLKKSGLEILSTGYMLIGNANDSAVGYMSNTRAIPESKTDIASATALAGEMIGQKLIYLEGGSGAGKPISGKMITAVKQCISSPLIVGGGIRSRKDAEATYAAGADILVVGNAIEKDPDLIKEISETRFLDYL